MDTDTTYTATTLEAGEEEEEEDQRAHDTILALNYQGGYLGCAYAKLSDHRLCIMEQFHVVPQTSDNDDYNWALVDTILLQVQPSAVLISCRVTESLESKLRQFADEGGGFQVYPRPSQEFSLQGARDRLAKLGALDTARPDDDSFLPRVTFSFANSAVPWSDGSSTASHSDLLRLESWIDTTNTVSVACSGAVISFVHGKMVLMGGQDEGINTVIKAVDMISLEKAMYLNKDTISALKIFDNESHPDIQKQNSKQGFSLFGILKLTVTPLGEELLRTWFLLPSLSLEVINYRHDGVELFLNNQSLSKALRRALMRVKNVPRILLHMRMGICNLKEWQSLVNFLLSCTKIKTSISENEACSTVQVCRGILDTFDEARLRSIGNLITYWIDFVESQKQQKCFITRGIDCELDRLCDIYNKLDNVLCQVAQSIVEILPIEFHQHVNVIYFPQVGYLVSLATGNFELNPLFTDYEWEFQFSSGNDYYYKTPQVRHLDIEYGDIYNNIQFRHVELLHNLQVNVLMNESFILDCMGFVSELDVIIAFSEAARRYKYVRPIMTKNYDIDIEQGRHPLVELSISSTFMANDTLITGRDALDDDDITHAAETYPIPSVLVLTGANYSGKSVYLKQVGLIVFMAQIGGFVPAKRAKLGITDKILTRITTRDSVSIDKSSFLIDLQQISIGIKMATKNSLFIIDEFGKGTDTTDGPGLCCAVIEYLSSRKFNRPRVILATHFHEILHNEYIGGIGECLKLAHMQIMLNESDNEITYLYKLEMGSSSASFGTCCAALNGIPDYVLDYAKKITNEIMLNGGRLIMYSDKDRQELITAVSFFVST